MIPLTEFKDQHDDVRITFKLFCEMTSDPNLFYLLYQQEWYVVDDFSIFVDSEIVYRDKKLFIDNKRFITLEKKEFERFRRFESVRKQYTNDRHGLTKNQRYLLKGGK